MRTVLKDEGGAGVVEYMMLLGLISVLTVGAVASLGLEVRDGAETSTSALASAVETANPSAAADSAVVAPSANIVSAGPGADHGSALFSDDILVLSASATGDPAAFGRVDTDLELLSITDGLAISTGDVSDYSNDAPSSNLPGSIDNAPDFDSAAGGSTYDAAWLDADFIPSTPVTLDLVYVSDDSSDVPHVLLNGSPLALGSLVPGAPAIEGFDGSASVSVTLPVQVGHVNTIRIGVADGGDAVVDSAIFAKVR